MGAWDAWGHRMDGCVRGTRDHGGENRVALIGGEGFEDSAASFRKHRAATEAHVADGGRDVVGQHDDQADRVLDVTAALARQAVDALDQRSLLRADDSGGRAGSWREHVPRHQGTQRIHHQCRLSASACTYRQAGKAVIVSVARRKTLEPLPIETRPPRKRPVLPRTRYWGTEVVLAGRKTTWLSGGSVPLVSCYTTSVTNASSKSSASSYDAPPT